MKTLRLLTAAAISCGICGSLPAQDLLELRDAAQQAKIGLRDAVGKALEARAGHAVEAELEMTGTGENRRPVIEVAVLGEDGALYEVVVDARSGEVGPPEKEDDEDAESEAREFRSVLLHTELAMVDLIARAEEVLKGTPVSAVLEMEDGSPLCEVYFVNSRYLIEVGLEGRAGHLVELELEREDDDGDEHAEEGEDESEDESDDEKNEGGASQRTGAVVPADLPKPTPMKDGARFSAEITHAYFPLSKVRYTVLEGGGERVIREVQDETKGVAGVTCLVLAEKEYEDGELAEISYNYFAQDADGNVWYFGENVDDYQDGKVVGHSGEWLVGQNAKEPCLFMPAELEPGRFFKREDSPPDAEEWDQVETLDSTVMVPTGTYTSVLVVKETDRPDRWEEKKYYAKDIGLISENQELNLVRIGRPR